MPPRCDRIEVEVNMCLCDNVFLFVIVILAYWLCQNNDKILKCLYNKHSLDKAENCNPECHLLADLQVRPEGPLSSARDTLDSGAIHPSF